MCMNGWTQTVTTSVWEAGMDSIRKRYPLAPVAFGSEAAPDNGQGNEDPSRSSHRLILKC